MEWDENEEEGGPEFESSALPAEFIDLGDVSQPESASLPADNDESFDEEGGFVEVDSVKSFMGDSPEVLPETDSPVDESAATAGQDLQPSGQAANGRDLSEHPLRYSPVTGERSPPNTFYLPWKPPAAADKSLPLGEELGGARAETGDSEAAGSSTNPQVEPPGISRGLYVPQRDGGTIELGIDPREPPRQDIGQPFPRVQVIVSLAATRNLFDDALEAAAKQMAERFRKLALNEIEHAAWRRKCEERAADYRLRGPTF